MNKASKIWLTVAILLIIVGALIFVGALAVLDFDFAKLSTAGFETNTYEVNGDFHNVLIDVNTTNITFAPSNDENCRVVCVEREQVKHSVAVKDGTLVIDTVDTQKWYDHVGISFGTMKMTVYLPGDAYASLRADTDTGDIKIPEDFTFESIKITGDTADIVCFASVSNLMDISTTTGNIKADALTVGEVSLSTTTGNISINSTAAMGKVDLETDTGEIKLTEVTCKSLMAESNTGDISLNNVVAADILSIESDTGDVRFAHSDAASVSVKTSTGDVTGTLLSDKVFITETSTGDVSVPKTITGGKCEITTNTGDIALTIEQE